MLLMSFSKTPFVYISVFFMIGIAIPEYINISSYISFLFLFISITLIGLVFLKMCYFSSLTNMLKASNCALFPVLSISLICQFSSICSNQQSYPETNLATNFGY